VLRTAQCYYICVSSYEYVIRNFNTVIAYVTTHTEYVNFQSSVKDSTNPWMVKKALRVLLVILSNYSNIVSDYHIFKATYRVA
jgi:hypothetical protein